MILRWLNRWFNRSFSAHKITKTRIIHKKNLQKIAFQLFE